MKSSATSSGEEAGGRRRTGAVVFEDAEGLREALHRQGNGEFGNRLQFAVLATLHGFEAMKFEAHDAVDDRHLAQSVAKYVVIPSSPAI
jgi:hypothetical protein